MRTEGISVVLALVFGAAPALAGEAPLKIKTYPVSGSTGLELYESIGRNGPGPIAQTVMNLKWNRLFDERGGDCYLVKLRPVLTITMTLPKPKGALTGALKADWQRFADGVRKHEDVHVDMIQAFVEQAQTAASGAMAMSDKSCAKAKAEVSRRLEEARAAHMERSRAFDRDELGPNGAIPNLVLDLVQ